MIPPPEFRLNVGVYLSEEQLAELGEILRDFGFPNASITPIIGGPGGWTAIEIVVLGPMAAFFIALASEAGKDAYHGLKALLARLWAIEDREEDDLTISDEANNLLFLSKGIPDEAIEKLTRLDWENIRSKRIVWDAEQREWRTGK